MQKYALKDIYEKILIEKFFLAKYFGKKGSKYFLWVEADR